MFISFFTSYFYKQIKLVYSNVQVGVFNEHNNKNNNGDYYNDEVDDNIQ